MAANTQQANLADASTTYNDPTASQLNLSCLDFLLIELVPMAYRITNDIAARDEEWLTGASSSIATIKPRIPDDPGSTTGTTGGGTGTAGGGTGAITGTIDEEEAREAVFQRLESLGYRVGLGVVER
jgi:hypothetical protein